MTEPGDHRVRRMLENTVDELGVELEVRPDSHFLVDRKTFHDYANDRKSLLLENFCDIKPPRRFRPDDVSRDVIDLVASRFRDHPGSLKHFDMPVTHDEAMAAVRDFIEHRLKEFGRYEDAMWTNEPFLYHSRLSAVLNVKLVSPRYCITTLYWDFLDRHRKRFADSRRMTFQMKNLERKSPAEMKAVRERATDLRQRIDAGFLRCDRWPHIKEGAPCPARERFLDVEKRWERS